MNILSIQRNSNSYATCIKSYYLLIYHDVTSLTYALVTSLTLHTWDYCHIHVRKNKMGSEWETTL